MSNLSGLTKFTCEGRSVYFNLFDVVAIEEDFKSNDGVETLVSLRDGFTTILDNITADQLYELIEKEHSDMQNTRQSYLDSMILSQNHVAS